jgi:hypothetical protein
MHTIDRTDIWHMFLNLDCLSEYLESVHYIFWVDFFVALEGFPLELRRLH